MISRTDWTRAEIAAVFDLTFDDVMFQVQDVDRAQDAADEGLRLSGHKMPSVEGSTA